MTALHEAVRAAAAFDLEDAPLEAEALGSGHIHGTFSVQCGDGAPRYVVQHLNTRVFRDPEAVLANALLVTRTLDQSASADPRRRLRCVPTRAGGLGHRDEQGRVWRAFHRIEGVRTLDQVESAAQAERAARAFGEFTMRLEGLPAGQLRETIPDFHDLAGRVAALEAAALDDRVGRRAGARAELEAARELVRALEAELPPEDLAGLPLRIVHNDCKLNNVLFDEATGEALCVIDLDTVMPGTPLFDFGDLLRTAACREPEDSRDLDRVRVEPDLYHALARGYLSAIGAALGADEQRLLPLAGPLISIETGVRFLSDHLAGDVYFRTSRAGHNLDRARVQLRLAERLLADLDLARRIVEESLREPSGGARRGVPSARQS